MNPVELTKLILKVAICTLPILAGLRLMFLSKESFLSFASRMFGIADLEMPPSSLRVVRGIGVLLVALGGALIYLFFIS